jgi:hypothetical protein
MKYYVSEYLNVRSINEILASLFIFTEAADGFGIALLVFGFKSCQIEQRILFLLLLEDPSSFRADLFALTMGNGAPAHCAVYAPHSVAGESLMGHCPRPFQ